MEEKTPLTSSQQAGRKKLRIAMIVLIVAAAVNLLLSASLAGLVGGILVMAFSVGLLRGDGPFRGIFVALLILYGSVNLVVLIVVSAAGNGNLLSLIWLGIYSVILIAAGIFLRRKDIRDYCDMARPKPDSEKKIHFFRGGWRDL